MTYVNVFSLKFYANRTIIVHFCKSLTYGDSPASILYKSIAGCYRPVRVTAGPITARYRFIKKMLNGSVPVTHTAVLQLFKAVGLLSVICYCSFF